MNHIKPIKSRTPSRKQTNIHSILELCTKFTQLEKNLIISKSKAKDPKITEILQLYSNPPSNTSYNRYQFTTTPTQKIPYWNKKIKALLDAQFPTSSPKWKFRTIANSE